MLAPLFPFGCKAMTNRVNRWKRDDFTRTATVFRGSVHYLVGRTAVHVEPTSAGVQPPPAAARGAVPPVPPRWRRPCSPRGAPSPRPASSRCGSSAGRCSTAPSPNYFYPGGGDASAMSTITEPLRKWGNLVTFIKGVNISGSVNHYAIRSMYTGGNVGSYTSPDPTLTSVDAAGRQRHRQGPRPRRSSRSTWASSRPTPAVLPPRADRGVLRPRAGRLRGQPGHRLRPPVRRRRGRAGPCPMGASTCTEPTPATCSTPR